jgi:hypothetical protein
MIPRFTGHTGSLSPHRFPGDDQGSRAISYDADDVGSTLRGMHATFFARPRTFGALTLGAIALGLVARAWIPTAHAQTADAGAQAANTVWYRIVQVGPGAQPREPWRRLGPGFAGTYAFIDDFEIDIRAVPNTAIVRARVRDGQAQIESVISCTEPNMPRLAIVNATRVGPNQRTFVIGVACSEREPR